MNYEENYQNLRQKIIDLGKLTHDWNSYGAEPIPQSSIVGALVVLEDLYEKNFLPDRILPDTDGSITFWNNFENRSSNIGIYDDGDILVEISYPDRPILILGYNEIGIDETVKRISDWIYLGV